MDIARGKTLIEVLFTTGRYSFIVMVKIVKVEIWRRMGLLEDMQTQHLNRSRHFGIGALYSWSLSRVVQKSDEPFSLLQMSCRLKKGRSREIRIS